MDKLKKSAVAKVVAAILLSVSLLWQRFPAVW